MALILAIGGMCGSGKTHLRNEHYPNLPYFDISDVYREYHGLRRGAVVSVFVGKLEGYLKESMDATVVVEAFFKPGGVQRLRVEQAARRSGAEVRWIWCSASRRVCLDRIARDREKDGENRNNLRRRLAEEADEKLFKARNFEKVMKLPQE